MDANKRKDLVETIKLLRKHGVKSLKCSEYELELTHVPEPRRRKSKDDKEAPEVGPTEEELLFWSANTGVN